MMNDNFKISEKIKFMKQQYSHKIISTLIKKTINKLGINKRLTFEEKEES